MHTTTIDFEHEYEIGQKVLYCAEPQKGKSAQWAVVRGIVFATSEGDIPWGSLDGFPEVNYSLGGIYKTDEADVMATPEHLFASEEEFLEVQRKRIVFHGSPEEVTQ